MQQSLLIALLFVALLATSAQAHNAPQAVTVYVHADQPVANMPVTATSGDQAIATHTDANGIAHLPIGAGEWAIEACGQSVSVETLDEDGTGGLLVIGCYRVLLPVAAR